MAGRSGLAAAAGSPCRNGQLSSVTQSQSRLASSTPLIARWVHDLLFWPLPLWFFAVLYVAVCLYALLLWRLVPPRGRSARGG